MRLLFSKDGNESFGYVTRHPKISHRRLTKSKFSDPSPPDEKRTGKKAKNPLENGNGQTRRIEIYKERVLLKQTRLVEKQILYGRQL